MNKPSVKSHLKGTHWELMEMFNENKTKKNSDLLLQNTKKTGSEWLVQFLERESSFSLDFPPFGLSVHFRPRSKVVLCGEGYTWTPIWWSSDNSKR